MAPPKKKPPVNAKARQDAIDNYWAADRPRKLAEFGITKDPKFKQWQQIQAEATKNKQTAAKPGQARPTPPPVAPGGKKTRAGGYIGSKYIPALAQAGGQWTDTGTGLGPYTPTDFGGGIAEQQARQIADASRGVVPAGFEASKWGDVDWQTNKYLAGRTLAASGKIGDILRLPQFEGWEQVSRDKIRSPSGNIYDLYKDVGGPQEAIQWTQVHNAANAAAGGPGTGGVPPELMGGGGPGGAAGAGGAGAAAGTAAGAAGGAPVTTPFAYDPFNAPAPFEGPAWTPPTGVSDANDPGYTARLREGEQAIQRAAAAKGTLATGGTLKDLSKYAQDYAANEYQNVYNRALQDYTTNYGREFGEYGTNYQNALEAYKTNFQTKFDPWAANADEAYRTWLANYNAGQQGWQNQFNTQQQRFNQLFQTAGLGQQAVGQQALAQQNYADQMARLYGGYGASQSDLLTNQANANAAAQAASGQGWANAWQNTGNAALGGIYAGLYGGQQTDPWNTIPGRTRGSF